MQYFIIYILFCVLSKVNTMDHYMWVIDHFYENFEVIRPHYVMYVNIFYKKAFQKDANHPLANHTCLIMNTLEHIQGVSVQVGGVPAW